MKEVKLEFNVARDVDFEDLIADIGFKDQLVAVLTQENGFQNMIIIIHPPKNQECWDFRLDEFEDVLHAQKNVYLN